MRCFCLIESIFSCLAYAQLRWYSTIFIGWVENTFWFARALAFEMLYYEMTMFVDERDSEAEGGDGTYGFLHPDHAYLAGSRRGSSQSEQLDVEQYQLTQTFSKSLPGSRRSSFQSTPTTDRGTY